MKRILCLLALMFSISVAYAQTQQGVVKTRGRMVNGQLVEGTKLSGATITLNFGNPLVSGENGNFSFYVPDGRSYSLVSAQKQGYTLADAEYTQRSFKYSEGNPFYVVLEDEAQRQADINAAIRKVRKTLTSQLEKREDEIEALKAQNKITEKEYQQRLQQLYDNQSKSEQLVKDMAKRYASTDYDQLDEFNRRVQQYIEEGELQKADSMIRSKGEIEQRVAEYHSAVAVNRQEREELNRRESELEQSEAGTAKTYEDLSQDLLRRSDIFLQEFKQDSALYCLKMRADLDTTNVGAVSKYAKLCGIQNKFEESERYYYICLNTCILKNDLPNLSAIQNNLGVLYNSLHDYHSSEKYYKLSLENYELLFRQNPDVYLADLARTQSNLGNLYSNLHDYQNSVRYHMLALENMEQLFRQNPDAYRANMAGAQNNLGNLHSKLHDYHNSEKYHILSLENYEQLLRQNPEAYRAEMAKVQGNLGNLYYYLRNYQSCEKYYILSLENYEQSFRQNPDAYRADMANTQNSLGVLYKDLHNYQSSEKYLMLSLVNYEQLFCQNPNAYHVNLARVQGNLGNLYKNLHDYQSSEKYLMLSLENYEQLFRQNPDAYRAGFALTQNNLGALYINLHDYQSSEKYYMLALENYEQLFRQNPGAYCVYMAITYRNLMWLYEAMEIIEEYDKYLDQALGMYQTLYEEQPSLYTSDLVGLDNGKVKRLLENGNVDEALTFAQEAYAMDEEDNDSKSNLAECYDKLAYRFAGASNFANAYAYIDKAISLRPDNANYYDSKGEILLMQGKKEEALQMWEKVLEHDPDFLKNDSDGTNLSNGLKELGLIE